MGDDGRDRLRRALEDLNAGLRSAFGLEPQRNLIAELLDGSGDEVGARKRRHTPPRRRRRSPVQGRLVRIK